MNQTPLLLALVRGDLDLNEIIKFMVKKLGYIDDLTTVVFPKEIEALQKELFPYMGPLRPAVCAEIMCCPPSQATEEPACRPMGFTTPQDELQATQHLIQGEFGQHITHILVLR